MPRGGTMMDCSRMLRKHGIKLEVEFNDYMHPIGENAAKMQSSLGKIVRDHVPIAYATWKHVPDDDKEHVWEAINLEYELDAGWKKGCLSSANDKWRQYKSEFTQDHIYKNLQDPEKLQEPPSGFGIPVEDWRKFVISRMTKDFKEKSDKQKERRKQNKYPHRLSRKGYARLAEEIKKELTDDQEVNRCILWKKGHLGKNGDFDGEDLREKAAKIDEYIMQKKEGKVLSSGPKQDILTRVIESKEHGGRVRAFGANVTPTIYFGQPKMKLPLEKMSLLSNRRG